jgi:pimeloyl-ACP methyl ester carboxylesterase
MQFASDVCNILDQMGVDKVHILACCCGAIYGLAFAAQHADRVSSVHLLAPWVHPDLASPTLRFAKRFVPMSLIAAVGWLTNQALLTSFTPIVESSLLPDERAALPRDTIARSRAVCEESTRRGGGGGAADLAACVGKTPWGYGYADIPAARPSAIIAGSADSVVRPDAVRALAAVLPQFTLEWVPASHTGLIALQRPAVYARIAAAAAADYVSAAAADSPGDDADERAAAGSAGAP